MAQKSGFENDPTHDWKLRAFLVTVLLSLEQLREFSKDSMAEGVKYDGTDETDETNS